MMRDNPHDMVSFVFGNSISSRHLEIKVYKVTLWLGRGFTTVPVSSLTLHSRGTGR